MAARRELFAGVMSGTSLDGIDAVLADFTSGTAAVAAATHIDFPSELRRDLLALQDAGVGLAGLLEVAAALVELAEADQHAVMLGAAALALAE